MNANMLSRLPAAALEGFLERIDWPADRAPIAARIREFAPSQRELQLNLVLEPELRPPLEVELFTDPTQAPNLERDALLDRLVAAGICCARKADVLRRVPMSRAPDDAAGVSWYLKLRMHADGSCSAKAYVGITPRCAWR